MKTRKKKGPLVGRREDTWISPDKSVSWILIVKLPYLEQNQIDANVWKRNSIRLVIQE